MSLPVDLHVHLRERGADGAATLTSELARRPDLALVALTDHDAFEPGAAALVRRLPLRLLLGVEITCRDEDGAMLHLLAIGVQREAPLLPILRGQDLARRALEVRAAALRAAGYRLPRRLPDELRDQKRDLARLVLEQPANRRRADLPDAGRESQWRFIQTHFPTERDPVHTDPALLAIAPTVGEAITRTHQAGAIAALAHPGLLPGLADLPARVRRLLRAHELDALEAYHPDHDETTRGVLVQLAYRLDLLALAGSDSHGEERALGQGAGRPDPALVDRLREQIRFYR